MMLKDFVYDWHVKRERESVRESKRESKRDTPLQFFFSKDVEVQANGEQAARSPILPLPMTCVQ